MTTATRDSRVPPQIPIKYVAKIRRSVQRYTNDCAKAGRLLILLMVHDGRGHFTSLNENLHFDQACVYVYFNGLHQGKSKCTADILNQNFSQLYF